MRNTYAIILRIQDYEEEAADTDMILFTSNNINEIYREFQNITTGKNSALWDFIQELVSKESIYPECLQVSVVQLSTIKDFETVYYEKVELEVNVIRNSVVSCKKIIPVLRDLFPQDLKSAEAKKAAIDHCKMLSDVLALSNESDERIEFIRFIED